MYGYMYEWMNEWVSDILSPIIILCVVGALGIGKSTSVNDTGTVFVGLYMIVFAGIVVVYEISQILPSQTLDIFMKKNFGFLFGYVGKGLFFTL